jgi:hypothetical protein
MDLNAVETELYLLCNTHSTKQMVSSAICNFNGVVIIKYKGSFFVEIDQCRSELITYETLNTQKDCRKKHLSITLW